MNYTLFTAKNMLKFDSKGLLKVAEDIATLLDHPILEANEIDDRKAEMREAVFHDFCAICVQADIPVPELEPILYEAHLTKVSANETEAHREKIDILSAHIRSQLLDDSSEKNMIMSCVTILTAFPSLNSRFGNITSKQLEAFINSLLVKLGKKPIRPNYNDRKVQMATEQVGPGKPTKILIFDDSKDEIVRTARAFVGWKNIETEFLHYDTARSYSELSGEPLNVELKKTADVILSTKSKIVLMDQGLMKINGSDLTRVLLSMPDAPIVVANTGGSDDKLRQAGAFANCDKGSNLQGVKEAIGML